MLGKWMGRTSEIILKLETVFRVCERKISLWSSTQEAVKLGNSNGVEGFPGASAAAKSLQSCPVLCDPIDGSPPGSPSLGFSRQEHWSGLPLPSPMHESEKSK